jgi:hypothetical protein
LAEEGSKTRVDRIWLLLKNNRFIATFIVVGAVVIAIGQLTGALSEIMTFLGRWNSTKPVTTSSIPDAHAVKNADNFPCAGKGGALAIRAYAMAISDPNSLPEFVQKNSIMFAKDGNTTKCLSILTLQLLKGSASMAEAYKDFNEKFQANRPSGMAEELWRDPAYDMWALANYLQSLTTTLPLVAEGDVSEYYKSEIVTRTQKKWTLIKTDPNLESSMRLLVSDLNTQLMRELISALPQEDKQEKSE